MKDKKLLEELSAYLDGEADDPAAIKRLIQRDADAARKHMELARLSAHVQALEGPEPDPAFVTRVMAHVQEEPVKRRGWLRIALPVAAALLVIAGGALFALWPQGDPATRAFLTQVEELQNVDAEALEAQLERVLAASPQAAHEIVGDYRSSLESGEPVAPAAYDMLADAAVLDQISEEIASDEPVDAALNDLSPEETETLKELLVEYATEGWTT